MKKYFYYSFLVLTIAASGALVSCTGESSQEKIEVATYQCPMDCEEGKTYDKEGMCPVCEMELKPIESSTSEGHSH